MEEKMGLFWNINQMDKSLNLNGTLISSSNNMKITQIERKQALLYPVYDL